MPTYASIRRLRDPMNSIARWRYPRYSSRVPGSGDAVKSANDAKNRTVDQETIDVAAGILDKLTADKVAVER